MRNLLICDTTLKRATSKAEQAFSFREKLEIAKLLDNLNVSVIETGMIVNEKVDSLCIKAIAGATKNSIVSATVPYNAQGVELTWEALKSAQKPRLQLSVPVSPVGMEYTCNKKPADVMEIVKELIANSKKYCSDVEFVAEDASRAVREFLYEIIETAINAGATTVTLADDAGILLPAELTKFISEVEENVPQLKDVCLGVQCANELSMAVACSAAAINAGVSEVKVSSVFKDITPLDEIATLLSARADSFEVSCSIQTTALHRNVEQMKWITESKKSKLATYEISGNETQEFSLTAGDDKIAVESAVLRLGYDLSEEDNEKVFEEFNRIARKKDITAIELDAIVASTALQVPQTYTLESYVINCGNIISATANITMDKSGKKIEGLSKGDGPIDAAFRAIEKIVGSHYEVDDFQILAVTEGREAMGSALVKLRANGKLYSGKGISTDIVGASIRAYVSALNKIAYEEEN